MREYKPQGKEAIHPSSNQQKIHLDTLLPQVRLHCLNHLRISRTNLKVHQNHRSMYWMMSHLIHIVLTRLNQLSLPLSMSNLSIIPPQTSMTYVTLPSAHQ